MKPRIRFNRKTGKYECSPIIHGWKGFGLTIELAYAHYQRMNHHVDCYHLAA